MAVAPATVCTNNLPNIYPCVKCLSEKEMMQGIAVLLYALANSTGTVTAAAMEADAHCFTCLSDKELLEAVFNSLLDVAIDLRYFDAATDLTELNGCIKCLDPKIIKAIIVRNLCVFAANTTSPA